MRIAVYTGPKLLEISEINSPMKLGNEEVRIKSLYSGISHGTEMGVYRGQAPFFSKKYNPDDRLFLKADSSEKWGYPIRSCDPGVWYLGYSLVGMIKEIGENVQSLSEGDFVYLNASHQSEHIAHESAVVKLPSGLDPKYGVVLTNLLTAFNGILDSKIKLGDIAVIMGQGVIGQLVSQLAKFSGARVYVVDIISKRLKVSLLNGSDGVLNPKEGDDVALEIRKKSGNRGADVVIDASGSSKSLNESIRTIAPEKTVVVLSWLQGETILNLADEFHHNRVRLHCSQANHTSPEHSQMWPFERKLEVCVQLLLKLKIDNLISNVYEFEDIAQAYHAIDEHPEKVIQTVLKY